MSDANGQRLSGADRVLAALKLLAEHPRGMRLDELRRELATPKSTAHRILVTLRRADLVSQDDDGRYRLSMEFVRLAFRHYEALDDRSVVQGALDALVDHFTETAYYARLDGSEVVYVGMRHPPGHLHTASQVGARSPAHRTSLGKAMLAYTLRTREDVDRYVDAHGPLLPGTATSVTNAAELHRELAATRARGWAVDNEENEIGVVCVGFPLFLGPTARPSGAISVAAIKIRTPLDTLTSRTDEISQILERHLGPGALRPPPEIPTPVTVAS